MDCPLAVTLAPSERDHAKRPGEVGSGFVFKSSRRERFEPILQQDARGVERADDHDGDEEEFPRDA